VTLSGGVALEGNETLFIILMGATVIIGLVGTVGYYFARYWFKSTDEAQVPPPRTLTQALSKTREGLWGRMQSVFASGQLDQKMRDELEEILYTSDLGVVTVEKLMEAIDTKMNKADRSDESKVREALRAEILLILKSAPISLAVEEWFQGQRPLVLLIVGVNGAGKTTTIGKLAYQFAQTGRKVLLAAGDTFRAAAGAQLRVWTERAQVEILAPEGVTDPGAVAHMAFEHAKAHNFEVVIVDTAGRLHTQAPLMEELKKVKRVLSKLDPSAPHQTLLVLDANSGQNAIVQARQFHQALDLSGVILTKMDGTAKGGVAVSLAAELNLTPVLIGVGEGVADLRPFDPQEYVDAIL
jgi:fused signal recognition particle receptor